MARYNEFAGPKLPTQLLEKVYGGKVDKHGKRESSRKEKRKAERLAKKKVVLVGGKKKPVKWKAAAAVKEEFDGESEGESAQDVQVLRKSVVPAKDAKPVKGILKRRASPVVETVIKDIDDGVDEEEEETDRDSFEGDVGGDDERDDDFTVSRSSAKAKLDDDDAMIARLEAKLGIKGKKGRKEVSDDDWDFLIHGDLGGGDSEDGEDDEEEDEEDDEDTPHSKGKRKHGEISGKSAADDEWLQRKRKKANGVETRGEKKEIPADVEEESSGDEISGDEMSADDWEQKAPRRQRENPYIAPVTKDDSAAPRKYIPPSLRPPPSTSDEVVLGTIRRQAQGQLNRLSEANLPSILAAVVDMYTCHPRQHVTSTLVSLLTDLIADPSILSDTFLLLHAAFATALYRSLGPDFGAPLVESLVKSFDSHHHHRHTPSESQKQALNIVAFLSTLYTLHATSHEIIFDYIRSLLDSFSTRSESNTELLLRIIRISGLQLRSDDPSSLKDIVLILQRETSKLGGDANLSVRTKFMMETIIDLKNNRVKTGVAAKNLSAEHMQRMRKTLGNLKAVKTTEPLRITIADIRDSEKKGKWWLVGASWKDPAKHDVSSTSSSKSATTTSFSDDTEEGEPDLTTLARTQGMNTTIRSALFVALVGALDPTHAQIRIGKLGLRKKQLFELPRVLIHCVGMEKVYNHFYTCVALLFPAEGSLQKAWRVAVGDVLRRVEDEGEEQGMQVREVYSLAKMLGHMLAEGALSITVLKTLEFGDLGPRAKIFVQVLFTTVFVALWKRAAAQVGKGKGEEWKRRKEEVFEGGVRVVFERAFAWEEMVLGLRFVVEKVVKGGGVVGGGKEGRVVEQGCAVVERVLVEGPGKRVVVEEGEEDSD